MTTHPEICGLVDGDCPYLKQLQELLQDPSFQGLNLQDFTTQDGDCATDCPDKQHLCQSLAEFIKQFGLLPVFESDVKVLPLPPKLNLIKGLTNLVSDGELKDLNKEKDIPLQKPKSRELRAGRLYRGCDCEKRYGLQDSCPRTECQGSPACQTQPPTCGPSQFCAAKHLIKKMKPNWRATMYPNQAQKYCVKMNNQYSTSNNTGNSGEVSNTKEESRNDKYMIIKKKKKNRLEITASEIFRLGVKK